jgi:hypothetical protein
LVAEAGDLCHSEAIMTEQAAGAGQARLTNPLLDLNIAGLEAQLKAWQAYQVEGTQFVAKRLRANLELLRAFGHCSEVEHVSECHKAWVRELQADYAEELGRLAATTFALCFADLAAMGLLFGPRTTKLWPNVQPAEPPKPASKLQAVA